MYYIRSMNIDDLNNVIKMHKRAFPDTLSSQLGETCLHAQYLWFIRNYPEYAYVATQETNILGFVVGAKYKYRLQLMKDTQFYVIRGFLLHPWLFLKVTKKAVFLIFDQIPFVARLFHKYNRGKTTINTNSSQITLATIAVDKDFQGHGIGKSLVNTFEQAALCRQIRHVHLTVLESNKDARRIYEQCGWVLAITNQQVAEYTKVLRNLD